MKKLLFLFTFVLTLNASGQLVDGTTAPDFTLTDYYGTTHNLYSYLDAGKTVFVEIFAAHCPGCWAYHQSEKMKNLYTFFGPDGSNELMVLALEHDEYNGHNAFIGDGDPWVTQGNWLEGTPYPIFNVEYPDRGVFDDYNVNFYPVIYKVCPDRLLERISTSLSAAALYDKVQECLKSVSVEEESLLGSLYIDQFSRSLIIDQFQLVSGIRILDSTGRSVKQVGSVSNSAISINELKAGIYLFQFQLETGVVTKRLYVP